MRNLLIICVTEPLIVIIIQFLGYYIVAYNDILFIVRTYIAISYRHLLHKFLRVCYAYNNKNTVYSANTRCWSHIGLMLAHIHRRWPNIGPTSRFCWGKMYLFCLLSRKASIHHGT